MLNKEIRKRLYAIMIVLFFTAAVAGPVSGLMPSDAALAADKLTAKQLGQNNTISEKVLARVYEVDLPEPSYSDLPEWKGFNLLEKFTSNNAFTEKPFQLISKLGYHYVRLPMSYTTWIKNGDWNSINENTLKNIDKAIEYGIKYQIHIDLNFHRAPGYCVNAPKEKYNLWTSTKAQKAFVKHWRMFAKRYAGIPNTVLSFNLVNEPADVDDATYTRVMAMAIKAIREEDPNRLIIVDGLNYATVPCKGLVKYKVAQSLHSYDPFQITHYKASWVEGSDQYPVPKWPVVAGISTYLYGPEKADYQEPLVISGDIGEGRLGFRITQVSNHARIKIEADGKLIFDKTIVCTGGKGDWYQAVYSKEWKIYQNLFNKEYLCNIPAATKEIRIYLSEGDWLTYSEVNLYRKDGTVYSTITPSDLNWGSASKKITINPDGSYATGTSAAPGKDWLIESYLKTWADFSRKNGIGVMVGEWGIHNQTPHDVTLALASDKLAAFQELGFGWALWNFDGSFGIVNSGRSDVEYQAYQGYQLDKEYADLLSGT